MIKCNVGHKDVSNVIHISGHGDFWFDATTVASIFSLGTVSWNIKITFSSEIKEGFVLYLSDKTTRFFSRTERILYVTKFLGRKKVTK